MLIQLSTAGLC